MDLLAPDLGLFLWSLFIIPAILFLVAQHGTLKAISPANREMSPGEVWFQLIPVFNL